MKAKDLSELLMEYPDFDVELKFSETDSSEYGYFIRVFKITGITDIGYSGKVIVLDGIEE